MSQSRKHRGYESQRIVADFLQANGFPYAEPTGAGRQGRDILGVPGLDIEIKARHRLDLPGTIAQLREREQPNLLPLAILRPDGYGPARIHDWPAILPLSTAVWLLREAGYGRPNT